MYFKIGNFEVIARKVRPVPSGTPRRAVYCRTQEEFEAAVRAAGIDPFWTNDDFRRALRNAGIETGDSLYVFVALPAMRNKILDAEPRTSIATFVVDHD